MQTVKSFFQISVNGKRHTVQAEPDTPLLYILRNQLELNGPKYGCGLGQCGACLVLMNGRPMLSCIVPVSAVGEQEIVSLAGLQGQDGGLHPVQQAFVEEQAAQCGYCTSGMIIAAVALLEQDPEADDATIRQGLQGNLCRCGSQSRVLRAIRKVQERQGRAVGRK